LKELSSDLILALPEKVAGTLESLLLEECEITDSQFDAILPTLSCCSQLTMFSFYGNLIPMDALENLLRHTARPSQLSSAWSHARLDSYDPKCGNNNPERFSHIQAKFGRY
jgi:hypothetical protein